MRSHVLSHCRAVLLLVPFLALGCNDDTPPVNPVVPPVTVAPTPAPTPTPPVGCGAGPGTPNSNCSRESTAFLADVDAAIDRVVARRPEIFNLSDTRGGGGYFVLNFDAYYREVVIEMERAAFCAIASDGELGVKRDNTLSDQFDILLATGHVRRGRSSYRSTCRPAWF